MSAMTIYSPTISMTLPDGTTAKRAEAGEQRIARNIGVVSGNVAGSWFDNPVQQVQHYRTVVYKCVDFIAAAFADCPPQIVKCVDQKEKAEYQKALVDWRRGRRAYPEPRRFYRSDLILKAIGTVKQHEDYEHVDDSDPVAKLVRDPNEPQTGYPFWYLACVYYVLCGRCYIYKSRNPDTGEVVALYNIPAHWVRPVCLGFNRMVDYYEVNPYRGTTTASSFKDLIFRPEDLICIGKPSPAHPLAVTSATMTYAAEIDTYDQITAAQYSQNNNQARISAVLQPDAGALNLSDETIYRIESIFVSQYTGPRNAGRVAILEPGWSLVPPPTVESMQLMQSKEIQERIVIEGFGLDKSYWDVNSSTYSGSGEVKRKLRAQVLGRILKPFSESLTERLAREDFDDDYRLIYPEDAVQSPEERRADLQLLSNEGAITKNELRTAMGWEPYDDPAADQLMADAAQMPIGSGVSDWDAEGGKVKEDEKTEEASKKGSAAAAPNLKSIAETLAGMGIVTKRMESIAGEPIDGDWTKFAEHSGTLGIPREEMPQIKSIHRGALVNFLEARQVATSEGEVPAVSLKPTQAEFSRKKVIEAKDREGLGDRAILASVDRYIVDGHHQWLAKRESYGNCRVIFLHMPIRQLLEIVREFPSVNVEKDFDPSKHPRGGDPKHPGRFSVAAGAASKKAERTGKKEDHVAAAKAHRKASEKWGSRGAKSDDQEEAIEAMSYHDAKAKAHEGKGKRPNPKSGNKKPAGSKKPAGDYRDREKNKSKQETAKKNYVAANRREQDIADACEEWVAKQLGTHKPASQNYPADTVELDAKGRKMVESGMTVEQAIASGAKVTGGVEIKSKIVGDGDKDVTMDSYAQCRKANWLDDHDCEENFHTVVPWLKGLKDPSDFEKAGFYYRRGIGGSMRCRDKKTGENLVYFCKDIQELKKMMAMPEDKLPSGSGRTDSHMLCSKNGRWLEVHGYGGDVAGRKGFMSKKQAYTGNKGQIQPDGSVATGRRTVYWAKK